jgi:hypothetical protein
VRQEQKAWRGECDERPASRESAAEEKMRQVEGNQADNSDCASQALSSSGDGHNGNDTDRKEDH